MNRLSLLVATAACLLVAVFLAISVAKATRGKPYGAIGTPDGSAYTWPTTSGEQRVTIVGGDDVRSKIEADLGVLDCTKTKPGSIGINVIRRSDGKLVSLDFCRAVEDEKYLMK